MDGVEAMSRGISGGKQMIKCASTGNRGRVFFILSKREDDMFYIIIACCEDI